MKSRPPLARMLRIHELLQGGSPTTCRKLAAQLEVSIKTIMRDLAFMQDQLDLPVEYDAQRQSWRYMYPVKAFPTVHITEGEMFALLVACKALEQYEGTPYYGQLSRAFGKLSGQLKDRISFTASDPIPNISFHRKSLRNSDATVFEPLVRAMNASLEVEFEYRKPGAAGFEPRRVRPYHLSHREDAWYLIAFDVRKKKVRNYALARMRELAVQEKSFERPADFSPERYFAKAFGAYAGDGNYDVRIRFRPAAADRVKERQWHASQCTTELPDGGVEVCFNVGVLEEVSRWILGWADDAEVISPPELRTLIANRALATAQQYQQRLAAASG